jgi:uncharacterized protein YukE
MIVTEMNAFPCETGPAPQGSENSVAAWGLIIVANQINERFDRFRAELISELEKRFDQINGQIEQIDKKVDQLAKRIDQLDKRVDQLEERVSWVGTTIGSFKGWLLQWAWRYGGVVSAIAALAGGLISIALTGFFSHPLLK